MPGGGLKTKAPESLALGGCAHAKVPSNQSRLESASVNLIMPPRFEMPETPSSM